MDILGTNIQKNQCVCVCVHSELCWNDERRKHEAENQKEEGKSNKPLVIQFKVYIPEYLSKAKTKCSCKILLLSISPRSSAMQCNVATLDLTFLFCLFAFHYLHPFGIKYKKFDTRKSHDEGQNERCEEGEMFVHKYYRSLDKLQSFQITPLAFWAIIPPLIAIVRMYAPIFYFIVLFFQLKSGA